MKERSILYQLSTSQEMCSSPASCWWTQAPPGPWCFVLLSSADSLIKPILRWGHWGQALCSETSDQHHFQPLGPLNELSVDINKGDHVESPSASLLRHWHTPPTPLPQPKMVSGQASGQYSQIPRGKHSSQGVSPPPCPHLRFAFHWPFPAVSQFI